MASRPTQETPRELAPARERNPSPKSKSHPGGRGPRPHSCCPLLRLRRPPSLVSPRAVRAISPRVIHAASPRAVRTISPRGQNAPRTACAHVRTASSSAPSSQQAA